MSTTLKRLTIDDLEQIPEEHPGDRHELIEGELFVTPVPVSKHQTVSSNVVFALEQHVRQHHLGIVRTAPTGVRLSPENFLVPDACFVARDRLHIRREKWIDGAPDLVVEILSPGTRRRDREVKRQLYARFGVPEYWIIDPEAETETVLTLSSDHYLPIPNRPDSTIESHVLPDLELSLEQVFADVL
jgi:Uma2 family endonuclease